MIAKLIVWGKDREHALRRMDRALAEFDIAGAGIATTVDFHRGVIGNERFCAGQATTAFLRDIAVADLLAGRAGGPAWR
jgi:acetyl-CoA carboxylase biotin carboxylase subunit